MNPLKSLVFFLLLSGMLLSCAGSDDSPKALVNILLIDSPAQWDSVIVEVQGVELDFVPNGRDGEIQKLYFPYEPGDKEIDISQLVAGVALPVAREEMQIGRITGMTLRLGTSNFLYYNKKQYPLALPEGNTDYFQILDIDLDPGISYDLIIDFDLEKSIQVTNSNPIVLDFDPSISAYAGIGRGQITGQILPKDLQPAIYAVLARDSLSTHINGAGNFQFQLLPGEYTIYIDPKNGSYKSDTILNVVVETGKTTALDPITLFKK